MPVYDRSPSDELHEIDRWEDGFGWFAHPDETGRRASHAVRADDGVWVIDPVDAPGLDERLADLGPVVGVAVLCSHHARDAGAVASRHDVPVFVPRWMDRVEERTGAPVERFETTLGDSGFRIMRFEPLSMWQEAVAYREDDGTLIVPDLLGTGPGYTAGDERVGIVLSHRLFPPRDALGDLEPERILFGHGEGILEDADEALRDALAGSRRRFPRALATQLGTNLRLLLAATGD
ncbi:MBL fold metallo-hydrolase [Natrarchaeobius chitinivorans]|uniref:MBL fold metallo-hydrolase n=1 Tax=Natrarchaeobius chitinivorans TaxID=1679083 RepID=A0A3N6MPT5_NATCH|nr:MBL fold metallo-hydrolase [Natrarchaeobius chitinivorans]RQG96546.1 MBL fold metallo-hydrolase [Natrarchaeobius chitinivorans]